MVVHRPSLELGLDREFATLLLAVDTLWGGDIGSKEGRDHLIADTFPKDAHHLPRIYRDRAAHQLRREGGAKRENAKIVRDLVTRYNLDNTVGRLTGTLSSETDQLRVQFLRNMERCLGLMIQTALAVSEDNPLPAYQDRYEAVARRSPILIETAQTREALRAALAELGFEVTTSRGLSEILRAWEAGVGNIPVRGFADAFHRANAEILALVQANILSVVPFNSGDGRDFTLDGLTFRTLNNVTFTGSSTYEGGRRRDGSPAFKGLIEYNTDHPQTLPGLRHYVAHEVLPGHFMDSSFADAAWRRGHLGIEAVITTMCTTATVLREGWAQNAIALACGGSEADVVEQFGPNQRIQLLYSRLQDAGKNNASLLHQEQGRSLEAVRTHLREDCLLSDPLIKKLSGAWATHPIIGPMYGPAYPIGYEVVRWAIDTYGPDAVLRAGFHEHGYLDIETFQMALQREAAVLRAWKNAKPS